MKNCHYCQLPVADGGGAHAACITRVAMLQVLADVERRITSAPMPRHFSKNPRANYRMATAMALNPIADMRAMLQGCTLGKAAGPGGEGVS